VEQLDERVHLDGVRLAAVRYARAAFNDRVRARYVSCEWQKNGGPERNAVRAQRTMCTTRPPA
jgi:hypothetical protein